MPGVRIVEFVDTSGRSPFRRWFDGLNAEAAAKVTTALYRMGQGNFSNVKGVGSGVFEFRIDFGPGYRIYFSKDGDALVVLLGGSSKQRQRQAIAVAGQAWREYKQRKPAGR